MQDLLDQVAILFKHEVMKRGLKFFVYMEESTITNSKFVIDGDKIKQRMIHLVDNAIKFTNSGGISIRIKWVKGSVEPWTLFSS